MSTITDMPPLDTPEQISAEIAWVAREARELLDDHEDDYRRIAFMARKRRLFEATYDGVCPSWCTSHRAVEHAKRPEDSSMVHQTSVVVGEVEVEISKEDEDPDGTVVWLPEYDWVNGQTLDDMIEALTQARALVAEEG